MAAPVAPARASSLCPSSCNRVPLGRRPSACRSPRASWQGQRGIDKTVWDTVPAQHDTRPHQKGRCEEVLSPVVAPHPWRPAIANAGLIKSFLWDILWDRPKNGVPKPTSAQAIALIVCNPASCADMNVSREVAEASLAHVVKGVEASYQRSDLFERRRSVMERWSDYVIGTPSADVIPLHG